MSHNPAGGTASGSPRVQGVPVGQMRFNVDLALIALTMVVTVPRVGWWMARWEQPDLWFVGYAAAVVFDLSILRLAYVWSRASAGRQRAITLGGFVFFAVCSGLFQAFYLVEQRAAVQEAVPLAAIWPVALTILALHQAGQDERQERRASRSRVLLHHSPSDRPGRSPAPNAGQAVRTPLGQAGFWTPEQREEALRLAGSGLSVRQVAAQLAIPRSTVGGWVKQRRAFAGNQGRPEQEAW
jgi:hypothetical protein